MAIQEEHVRVGANAAAGFFEMVVVDGVVSGYAIVDFGCAVAMVCDSAAADFLTKVGGSAAAGYVAMVRDRVVEENGCVVAAAGYVVVVFDTCLFLHALMHDVDLQFDDQYVAFVCRSLDDE